MAPDRQIPSSTPDSLPSRERVARSAGLAGSATLVSRVLGLVRETVLASYFGAGNDMDAFLVAFRVPNLFRDLFAEGAMSAAFVPAFTRQLTLHGKEAAWRLGNSVLNSLFLVTAVLVVLGGIFAMPLVTAYAGDFARVPGKLELTVLLARVMLPFLTLVALATAVMGMLNALRYYFVPSLAPAAFNVAAILGAVALTPLMPMLNLPRVMAIAIAAVVGGVGQIAVQWPWLRREGFRYRFTLDPADPGLRDVLVLMGPGTLGLAATQVNLFVSTLLATGQGTGAVSWLQYAFRVMYLPIGLFGVSIATAVLPSVARHVALADSRAAVRTVSHGLALMLIVNVPATVGLVVLATPIVRLLLERGRFLPSDTIATAGALQCYAIGLVGYSATRIASPVFYALGRSRVAVLISTATIAVNLALSLVLVRAMGFRGLALATSCAAIVNGTLAMILLRRFLGGLEAGHLVATTMKMLVASSVMAAAVLGTTRVLTPLVSGASMASQTIRLASAILCGLVVLAAAARLLRVTEFDAMVADARERTRALFR